MKIELATQSFPKESRLLRRSEFRRVYDEGERRNASLCAVFYRPNGLPHTRIGITASARVGGAVLRNRLKRRVREVFRQNRAALPAGWDIVVNPRGELARASFATLTSELLRLFPSRSPKGSPRKDPL
jgi:ribonuclease P protein component